MKSIMYHYVRECSATQPYLRFLNIENFRRQLDFFAQEYGFVSRQEWEAFVSHGHMPSKNDGVILTFDDGLTDHFGYVLPELKKRNLWGIFYISTKPLTDRMVLDVHRIHLLYAKVPAEDLLERVKEVVSADMIEKRKVEEFDNNTYLLQSGTDPVTLFKRILNYFIDYRFRHEVINGLLDYFNVSADPEKHYMSENQIKEMHKQGMIIGSHSHNHPVMSQISKEQQNDEINRSSIHLKSIIGANVETYCHPYGGFRSFNDETINALNNNGVVYSFNVESKDLNETHIFKSPHSLPRYDCNEFPFGTAD